MKTVWGEKNHVGGTLINSTPLLIGGAINQDLLPSGSGGSGWTTQTVSGDEPLITLANRTQFECGELVEMELAGANLTDAARVIFSTGAGGLNLLLDGIDVVWIGDHCSGGVFWPKPHRKYILEIRPEDGLYYGHVTGRVNMTRFRWNSATISTPRRINNRQYFFMTKPATSIVINIDYVTEFAALYFRSAPGGTTFTRGSETYSGVDCTGGVFTPVAGKDYLVIFTNTAGVRTAAVEYA